MGIFNPVCEPLLLDYRRHPVRLLEILQHLRNSIRDSDEPSGHRLSDELSVGSPAELVVMHGLALDQETSGGSQVPEDGLVRGLDVLSNVLRHLRREAALVVDGAWRQPFWVDESSTDGDVVILLTKGRGLMYQAGTLARLDVAGANDLETVGEFLGDVGEKRLGLPA